jgi:hypothetical protein
VFTNILLCAVEVDRMRLRKNTLVCSLEPRSPLISAYDIHEWIHETEPSGRPITEGNCLTRCKNRGLAQYITVSPIFTIWPFRRFSFEPVNCGGDESVST